MKFSIYNKIRKLISTFNIYEDDASLCKMKSIISNRPVCIAVQTIDNCNARCVFCARKKIKPTNQLMPMALFDKLCQKYAAIGGGHLNFSPLLADPLIDPQMLDRIELLLKLYPQITPNIFTNGIGFTRFTDDEIKQILIAVHHLDISLGGLTRHDYHNMYGVDKFDEVWASLQRIYKISKTINKEFKINIHIRTNNKNKLVKSNELNQLIKMGYRCNDIADAFSSWGGLITNEDIPSGSKIIKRDNSNCRSQCFSPMYNFMVMQDGKVMACGCMDALCQMEVGDINEESITDIWLGDRMQAIRKSFENPETMYSICKSCAYYTPYEAYYSNPGLIDFDPRDDFWSKLK